MNSLKQNRCNQNTLFSLSLQSLETTNTAFKIIILKFFFFFTKNKKRGNNLKFSLRVYPSQISRGPVYRKHTKLLSVSPSCRFVENGQENMEGCKGDSLDGAAPR